MMVDQQSSERMLLPGAVGDPQVVPGRVEDPEVRQAPGPVLFRTLPRFIATYACGSARRSVVRLKPSTRIEVNGGIQVRASLRVARLLPVDIQAAYDGHRDLR